MVSSPVYSLQSPCPDIFFHPPMLNVAYVVRYTPGRIFDIRGWHVQEVGGTLPAALLLARESG